MTANEKLNKRCEELALLLEVSQTVSVCDGVHMRVVTSDDPLPYSNQQWH